MIIILVAGLCMCNVARLPTLAFVTGVRSGRGERAGAMETKLCCIIASEHAMVL